MSKQEPVNPILASTATIKRLFDYARDTLEKWEREGKLVEGIHFYRNDGQRRYVVPLFLDRIVNWNDDAAHQRAIQHWLSQLPSNQPLPKVRKL